MRISQFPAPLRLLLFLVGLAFCWVPFALPIALLVTDSNTETILTMSLLLLEFLVLVPIWGRWVHGNPRIFRTYGLVPTRRNGFELLGGLGFSLIGLFLIFGMQGMLGWLNWNPPTALFRVAIEGLITGLGVGFAEELVFRGWLLHELEQDYAPRACLWASSLVFAGLHFLKPVAEMIRTFPQFPGLVVLGVALVWAKRSTQGQLGLSIGLHAGLVWGYYILRVGSLTSYTGNAPVWMTGIDGNPLAGGVGLLFLSAIAWLMRQRAVSGKGV